MGHRKHPFLGQVVHAQRKRLGLSAADYAKLIGVSSLTVYNWEHGRTRPRQSRWRPGGRPWMGKRRQWRS